MVESDITPIFVAIVALVSSISVGVISAFFSRRNDAELKRLDFQNNQMLKNSEFRNEEKLKNSEFRNEEKLKRLEDELVRKREERNALRDYEYEARKRLYQELAPLLFQLNELAESALRRILALPRDAHKGYIKECGGWLSDEDGYFVKNTIYRLLAPLAVFKLMQRRLTLFDLALDPAIKTISETIFLDL
jgi:hypothetical protein